MRLPSRTIDGSGIPADLIDKIFDPDVTAKKTGSGLGLAISWAIIHKYDGTLRTVNRGKRNHLHHQTPGHKRTETTRKIQPSVDAMRQSEKNQTSVEAAIRHEARILFMDDEKMVREITIALLTMLGHEVFTANDGEEAVALYKKESEAGRPIDLVILDLTIPGGMGGREAAQEILALNPAATIVVASGYSDDPVMAQCQAHGFKAAIKKPFQIQELVKVLNKVLT